MLLTRAPLNQSSITTKLIPCDLHVLNTPPAFVLSQNQTLRKKCPVVNFLKSHLTGRRPFFRMGPVRLSHLTPARRGLNRSRGAQFNLFPLPSRPTCFPVKNGFFSPVSRRESPPLARSLLSHTVKELVSRGLKSRSVLGGVKPRTDRLVVSRVTRCRGDGRTLIRITPAGQSLFGTISKISAARISIRSFPTG